MIEEFFPYRKFFHEVFGEIRIPLVRLVLKHVKSIAVYAMVDSGAVISVFPKSVCELMGLKYEAGEEASLVSAAQEKIPIRVHKVTIRIGEIEFKARVGFSEMEKVPHVLGRLDVLDKVEIRFEKSGVRFVAEK